MQEMNVIEDIPREKKVEAIKKQVKPKLTRHLRGSGLEDPLRIR